MSAARPLLFAVLAATLWLPAPAAQASELVKLAKLIVTGKRSPTVPTETKPQPAAAPAVPAAPKLEPASGTAERAGALEANEPQEPAPRTELPRQERGGGERIGGQPRPQLG